MLIAGSRTKYYLLSLFGALVVAFGVFAISPVSKAQVQPPASPTIDKECTPNPVQIGEQVTCTIDVEAAPNTVARVQVTDTFPAGLTVTEATSQALRDGVPDFSVPCEVAGNTVTCPPGTDTALIHNTPTFPGGPLSFRATIEATAEQCGTFQNTATASGLPFLENVEDTEEIIVEGCEEPPVQQPQGGGGVPAPITQEGEQESEAGEIDQSFEVS